MELRFNRGQIGKDVGVIVFEVVENRRTGPVMNELASLVAEGRVVFIRLNDEGRKPAVRSAELRAFFAPGRHAADQITGLKPRCLEDQASIEVVVVFPCVPATAST